MAGKWIVFAGFLALFAYGCAPADNGLIHKESAYSFEETISKMETALAARDIVLMHRIDHQRAAAVAEMTLPPSTLLIFGNPAAGTQLMMEHPSIGLDLPLKALIYENGDGTVVVEFNNMQKIGARHGFSSDNEILQRVATALEAVTDDATKAAE